MPKLLQELIGSRNCFLITVALLIALTAFVIVGILGELAIRRRRDSDRAILDGSFGDQFPVELTIVVEGNRIGADRGAIWFADGLMGFSGSAASFVLEATDVAPQWEKLRMKTFRPAMPHDAILLCGAPRFAYVIVRPLLGHAKSYRERLAEFIRADEEPGGERFWPPLHRYLPQEETPKRSSGETRSPFSMPWGPKREMYSSKVNLRSRG